MALSNPQQRVFPVVFVIAIFLCIFVFFSLSFTQENVKLQDLSNTFEEPVWRTAQTVNSREIISTKRYVNFGWRKEACIF